MDERRLLIIEDDESFARTLARSFERRGYEVRVRHGPDGLAAIAAEFAPAFAVVDLRLACASGLACVKTLHDLDRAMRIVVLTGFASIATAVEAIKLGATNYLTKPADTDDIERAFDDAPPAVEGAMPAAAPTSLKTLEWEHIHQTLVETEFNLSEAARRLGLHRRTLVRKLQKRHVR